MRNSNSSSNSNFNYFRLRLQLPLINNYLLREKWVLLNNPRDEVYFRIFQCILNSVSRGREARAEGKKVEIL